MKNYNYQNENNDYSSPGPGPENGGRPPARDTWDTVSWVIDVGLIFLWFPVGLFLTIAHATGHDFVGKLLHLMRGLGSTGKKTKTQYTSPGGERQTGAGTREETARPEKETETAQPKPSARSGMRRADAGAGVRNVFGWILAAFGVIGALAMAGTSLWAVLTWLAVALGGGAMVISASMSRKKEAKFRQCLKITGETGLVDISKLSRTMGWKGAEADRNLSEMVERGYFGERAYIDHERGLLVIRPEEMRDVYRAEDMAKAAREAQTARAEQQQKTADMTEYERIVEAIRQADENIADEAMSEKIRRMQTITAAIFREVEEHPEKKSQIHRFMNYYLPTTLKLLDNYARIEAQGVTGRNTAKAKADIEGIADTLVAGYEKQLDALYSAEAMDIAGDVSVIENMMKRDGLTGSKDFGQTMGGH